MTKTVTISLSIAAALAGHHPHMAVIDELEEAVFADRSRPIGGLIPPAKPPLDDGVMTRQRRRAAARAAKKARRK